ncbi:phage portal protein [Streptomyces sp. NBC_00433]
MEVDARADLMCGIEELAESRHGYDKAAAYFDGTVQEVFSSVRLRRALAANDVDFRINFAKTPVTAVANRLKITAVTSPDDAQNKALADLWKANQLNIEAPDLHTKTCELGDGYLFVLPIQDDNDNVTGIEMYYNSPVTVRAIYREDRPREIDFVIKRWTERGCLRAEVLYDDHTERWTTERNSKGDQPRDWNPWPADDEDEESWTIPHSWDFPQNPAFHFRTARPYGTPEHYAAYGSQNAITKLTTTHMGNVDYTGAPQRYALTETKDTDTGDLDPGDWDDEDFPENANATGPTDQGDPSSLKSGPGELWLLRGFKAVGEFKPADPKAFLDPADWYIRALAHVTDTPAHLFDITGDAPSGESLRRKEAPLVDKVKERQKLFGATWTAAFTFALRLLGFDDPVVDVRWAPAATVDDLQGWQVVAAKIAAGVPVIQALMEAGYRQEQVEAWLSESDEAELGRRVQIIATFATAAQSLGTAVTLGALTEEQVTGILAGTVDAIELLGQPVEETA